MTTWERQKIDIEYNHGYTLSMKTAISLPDTIFESAERLARTMHISRSYLYTLAIKDFIEKRQKDSVTETLNELYSKENSKTDTFVQKANQMLLGHEEW